MWASESMHSDSNKEPQHSELSSWTTLLQHDQEQAEPFLKEIVDIWYCRFRDKIVVILD